jgi:uncharacterized Zn finger protein
MPELLSQILDAATVVRLASSTSYERGVEYLNEGRVGALRVSSDRVAADVQGTEWYAVELSVADGRLGHACSCPVGRDGAFCKHCVAVALAWLGDQASAVPTLDQVERYLEKLPREELVSLLIENAEDDERLARRLLLMASRPAAGESAELASLFVLIDRAFAHSGFVPYRELSGWVQGIDEAIDELERLLTGGRGGEVVELAEYALAAAERAMDNVDDSDGHMGSVIARLEELHLQACTAARPDPVALAERLFAWELGGPWDIFDRAVSRYQTILGQAGLRRYRELAEEAWADVAPLGPGDRSQFGGARFRITRLMEALAELSGNLQDRIAVHERDLSSAYRFLEIAELCRVHEQDDVALAWAERGMIAFAPDPDPRLRAFLRDEYRGRGRAADAYQHSIAAFAERPSLETYRELATDAGVVCDWKERREWALSRLRNQMHDAPASSKRPWLHERGLSELVRVFLWEGNLDAAWDVAGEGGCIPQLWLELAAHRRAEHPEDTLAVYRRHVEDVIAGKDKRAYAEAAHLIDDTIRTLFGECGRPGDFGAYVDDVRARHKPKRNLIKAIAEIRPTRY